MKRNKKFYGLLGAVTALALATPFIGSHIAKADTLYSDVVAWYDFNDGALTNSKGSSQAEAVVVTNQSWSKYTSDLAFGADRDKDNSEGKALQVGDAYGIELNEQNLGDNFSVSLWLKPDSTFDNNQVLVALGYHNPEDWYAISGNANGSDEVKIWCRNPNVAAYNGWYTKATSNISKNDWHHVVITGEGVTHKTYIDGTLVTSSDFTNVLSGENQDIYIAVNNWDKRFSGLVDDVIVYNRTISAGEVERLFTGQTAEQLLEESEITVSDVATSVNRVAVVNVNVPEAVKDDAKLTYDIADKSIATVDKDGNVTGVSKGETTITVTAKLGATEKSATAKVTVESSLKGFLAADYGFDGNITDATGSVESTLYGTKLSDYSQDAAFAEGIDGQALKLSNYGLDLGVRDLG
ncbi:MAG: Ig-like domain-containing protein, partial [Pseudobutyrivibrio sp.]|nr:Ig-like domain-containing protein [Pseudobutyrivibrio sp.]